jgi:hypothetical protein
MDPHTWLDLLIAALGSVTAVIRLIGDRTWQRRPDGGDPAAAGRELRRREADDERS